MILFLLPVMFSLVVLLLMVLFPRMVLSQAQSSSSGGGMKSLTTRPSRLLVTEESRDRVMIWTDYEAYVLQVKQIGVSACGATAVINVLVSSPFLQCPVLLHSQLGVQLAGRRCA